MSGFSFTPEYIWLDENNELFALALGWMGLVPQGMQTVLPQLQTIQDQAEQDYHREVADRLTKPLPTEWILRNVSIVDVNDGTFETSAIGCGVTRQNRQDHGRCAAGHATDGKLANPNYRWSGPDADSRLVGYAHPLVTAGRPVADRRRRHHGAGISPMTRPGWKSFAGLLIMEK